MRFPPDFIERLRSHFLLSEVIGRRIAVRRHGREFQALCPFHSEKSPSFTISDEKGFYHCFGCGAHGDAIGFVMEFDKLRYPEAVERLAQDAGIAMPVMTQEAQQRYEKQRSLYDVMEAACTWFEAQLRSPSGRDALHYVTQRGMSRETVARHRLGFAPAARSALKQALSAQGIAEAEMVEAGLLIVPDDGASYDRFRGRLIFPIYDGRGKVIAFGGRILAAPPEGQSIAKYLNSPETPIFHKGATLYHLHRARGAAKDSGGMIVVEGYMDVIALSQAGIENAVAPLGTAVTEQHLRLLWQVTPEPVLCLDGDAAGKRAMSRAAALALPLLQPGNSLRFALLPRGEDPDSLVCRQGGDAFRQVIGRALPLSDVLWEMCGMAQPGLSPERKAAAEKRLGEWLAGIADATVRNHYRDWMREKLRGFQSMNYRKAVPGATAGKPPFPRGHLAPPAPVSMTLQASAALGGEDAALLRAQAQCLKLLLRVPSLLAHGRVEEELAHLECSRAPHRALRDALLGACMAAAIADAGSLEHYCKEQGVEAAMRALLDDQSVLLPRHLESAQSGGHDEIRAALAVWRELQHAVTLARLQQEYRAAEREMSDSLTEDAMHRMGELRRQIEELQGFTYSSHEGGAAAGG